MNFKCEFCGGKTKQVYETGNNVFMQCKKDHRHIDEHGKAANHHAPVFMIRKEEVNQT